MMLRCAARLMPMFGLTLTLAVAVPTASGGQDWTHWRGPKACGVAPQADPPVEWSETRNVRWKVELPGSGHASPIVWGNRVYVLTAIRTEKQTAPAADDPSAGADQPKAGADQPAGGRGQRGRRGPAEKPTQVHQFAVLALERPTGRIAWQKVVREEVPHEAGHTDSTQASASPLTDGKHLYAYFGSRGLYCLDLDGNVVWEKDLGDMHTRNEFGEGSSPTLAGDLLIVNWDHEGDSFIVALDRLTGSERWRQPRDEPTSWNTPLVVEDGGKPQVIVTGSNRVRAYDLATGDLVWECAGLGTNCIPSAVALDGVVYAMSGHREKALLAIRYAGARGDLTDSPAVVWRRDDGTPYVPSPLLYDDTLYTLEKNSNIFYAIDARTGRDRYERQRLEPIDGVYASPVGAAGRVYVLGRNGVSCVLAHGPEFRLLATNTLDDGFEASPAIVGNEIFLRGRKHLYCIAPDK